MEDQQQHVLATIGEAQMIKTKSGIQYRIAGLWTNPEAYANYVNTVRAGAMANIADIVVALAEQAVRAVPSEIAAVFEGASDA